MERVGQVAYHLRLPEGACIHPVFHSSILKPFKGSPETVNSAPLRNQFIHDQSLISPLAILNYRHNTSGDNSH